MTGRRRRLLPCVLLLALAGCQTVPPPGEDPTWSERKRYLGAIDTYETAGKMSLTTPAGSEQASFTLNVDSPDLALQLSGPFGIGAIRLEILDGEGRLVSARHGEVVFTDTERELTELLGYPVPLDAIRYWALGLPEPSAPHAQGMTDDGRRLAILEQRGWRVNYETYRTVQFDPKKPESRLHMPRKVRLIGPDVTILMVFRKYSL